MLHGNDAPWSPDADLSFTRAARSGRLDDGWLGVQPGTLSSRIRRMSRAAIDLVYATQLRDPTAPSGDPFHSQQARNCRHDRQGTTDRAERGFGADDRTPDPAAARRRIAAEDSCHQPQFSRSRRHRRRHPRIARSARPLLRRVGDGAGGRRWNQTFRCRRRGDPELLPELEERAGGARDDVTRAGRPGRRRAADPSLPAGGLGGARAGRTEPSRRSRRSAAPR